MNKQQLASKIWESANRMRSKIEANEYKDYILGFIFYKFLSDKEIKYLKENDWTEEYFLELTEEDSETVDSIRKNLGYFIAYDNLFSTWITKGSDFSAEDVTDALSAFSRLVNPSHKKVFDNIFATLQTGLSKLGETSGARTKAIRDLIYLIKDIPMDGRQDYDVLGFIYEYLISNFAANAGKKAGEFYTPHEVSLLMSEIVAAHLKGRSKIKIYDDGITGTKASKREEFQRMLDDCEAGKIDIILTKSISRFARNTVDLLETVRHLKEQGIEVRFEKENINSLSGDGEVMMTLLASFAQEEITSLSNNVKWGVRKRMEQGIPNGHFRIYGYRWEGDQLVIEPEEAAIVRRIFQNFLDGKSRLETEREFEAEGITTANGCRWVDSNIKVVLTNITYTGNLLLQKEFIEDPITKRRKKNRGELPQYYVEDTHEAIIDMETFQYVQEEMARRKELGAFANKSLNITCFTSKLKCSKCGSSYVRNQRSNRTKYTSTYGDTIVVWVCGTTKKKGGRCSRKDIPERVLREACAEALGLAEFDEDVFLEKVDYIMVNPNCQLEFHFYDGTTKVQTWESTARKDCWTDEHKDRQRAWIKEHMATSSRFSPFTTRVVCGCCGGSCRRQTQPSKLSETGKIAYWRCSGGAKTKCGIKGIREPELMEITAQVMGTPEFDGDAFREQVDHITMVESGKLEYTFLDGHTQEAEYSTEKPSHPWSDEQRAKFMESTKDIYTPERRKAMSEHMKKVRSEKHWASKRK